jgi:hypothetical protein
MINNRTYGIDKDVLAYQNRLVAGGAPLLNANALRKLNQFVIGLKKLNAWGLITDIWLTTPEYNSINAADNSTVYALKSSTNNATFYNPAGSGKITTKGFNNFTSNASIRTKSYDLYTPMTIWCIASTDRDPALGAQSTNALVIAENYNTNGFRSAFSWDVTSYFFFWTSESFGNIGLGSTTTTPISLGKLNNIFFGVNSSQAFLYFNNTKLTDITNKTMIPRTALLSFGQGDSGKDMLHGNIPFILFAQYDLQPYYDDLYKLVKSTVGQGLVLP